MNDGQFVRMERRLENWGSWASSSGGGKGHCASAEHRYVAERLGEDEQAVHRVSRAIDVVDAELLEEAVTALRCRRARYFLQMAFVDRMSRPTLERTFKIYGDLYPSYRRRVAGMVAESISDLQVKLIRRGQPLWAGVARTTKGRV